MARSLLILSLLMFHFTNIHSVFSISDDTILLRERHGNRSRNSLLIPHRLIEGNVEIISLNVTDIEWRMEGAIRDRLANFHIVRYMVTSRNPRVANIINSSLIQHFASEEYEMTNIPSQLGENTLLSPLEEGSWQENSAFSVLIVGRSLGRTVIDVDVYGKVKEGKNGTGNEDEQNAITDNELRLTASVDVCVVRRLLYHRLSSAFTIFVAIITIITTFLIGTQLEWKIIIKELKRPLSLLLGCACEFIFMPLIAFALALTILRGNYGWQLACLAIGSCPGGGHSPFWTMMLDGNLDLAVAMSFVASVAALGVLPFWLFTLGRVFYGGRVTIPYITITGSLFGLICPIFIGLAFKHFLPKLAERIGRILKLITVISFVVVGIFGCIVNSYVFALLDWRHFVGGALLPWSGYFITYPFSRWICRRTHADSVAIAVENGCLNVAVPVVLLQLSLVQPDADLSLVVPVGIVICSSWPLWTAFVYLLIKRRVTPAVRTDTAASTVNRKGENQVLPSQNVSTLAQLENTELTDRV